MAEPHLDHPGEIHWFKGHGPAPVLGPCPHAGCKHLGQGVIAHGPSYERYELVACGSIDPADESANDCAMHCRAWVDERGRAVTPWLRIDLGREMPDRCPLCREPLYSPAETDAHNRLYHGVGPVETTSWGAEP